MSKLTIQGLLTVCATALALVAATAVTAGQPLVPIAVTGGQVAGSQEGTVKTWLGIPFAAPPVGDLRWRSPQPVIPWQGVRDAQSLPPACAQTATWIPEPKDEDCLYLNVWAPENAQNLPVMVWIHGGGYYGGSGVQPSYDGGNLAQHGAVVVTINYRLGILGFFAHPELSAESPHGASGNQGIEDQIAALQWVRDNIAAFGGDPGRVTVMGSSAGGESVTLLMASPVAKGLFHRGIAQSGNYALPIDPSEDELFSRRAAEARSLAFAKDAAQGSDAVHLSDLRRMSVAALHKVPWYILPTVDGYVVREDLTSLYAHQRQNDVPLLVGWTADEGKDLAPELLRTGDFNAANHKALVAKVLGYAPSEALLARYPGTTDDEARASINRLTNDWWGWRMWYWAQLHARHAQSKSYVYYFAHMPAQETPCYYGCGVGHGVETQYALDNLDVSQRAWTANDRRLASQLADTWVRFAATGSPNGPGLPDWPSFDESAASVYVITTPDDPPAAALPDFSLFLRTGDAAAHNENLEKEANP